MPQRKGFNFYASYFDVFNELDKDKDKIQFIEALLKRQFHGVEPTTLKGMAKFAYVSQKHSIDQQVKGWEDKTGEALHPPIEPPTEGEVITPTQQEKGQGEGKVKEEGKEKGQQVNPLYTRMVKIYFQWMKSKEIVPNFNSVEGKSMKSLIAYFKKALDSDDKITESFTLILKSWDSLDTFYQKQIKVAQINSNIVNIINQLKNGTGKQTGEHNDTSNYNGTGVSKDYVQAIFDRVHAQ